MADLVGVEHVHTAETERALPAAVEVACLERLDLGSDRVQEAVERNRFDQQLVELGELVEMLRHVLDVLHVVGQEGPESREALGPGARLQGAPAVASRSPR